jgi:ferritin-like metal-binding protein YciE
MPTKMSEPRELFLHELGDVLYADRKCPGIEGIEQEHDDFAAKESPSQDVLDSFLTDAGARTEHYEIAAYERLVTMAEPIGEMEVVELLTDPAEPRGPMFPHRPAR